MIIVKSVEGSITSSNLNNEDMPTSISGDIHEIRDDEQYGRVTDELAKYHCERTTYELRGTISDTKFIQLNMPTQPTVLKVRLSTPATDIIADGILIELVNNNYDLLSAVIRLSKINVSEKVTEAPKKIEERKKAYTGKLSDEIRKAAARVPTESTWDRIFSPSPQAVKFREPKQDKPKQDKPIFGETERKIIL